MNTIRRKIMSKQGLEKIVASLELCKLIPAGEFDNTALVWHYTDVVGFLCRTSTCEQIHKKEWQVVHNHPGKIARRRKYGEEIYPAPTLEEILDAINDIKPWNFVTLSRAPGNNARHADYPLKRWLQLKGIEEK